MYPSHLDQSRVLSTLTRAPAERVKALAEELLPALGEVEVLQNRTGLAMLPYRDSAQGELFHLGEVLVSEAHVRLGASGEEGYAACLGRDLELALAVALLDASLSTNVMPGRLEPFIAREEAALAAEEDALLRQVEATRVEMETF